MHMVHYASSAGLAGNAKAQLQLGGTGGRKLTW